MAKRNPPTRKISRGDRRRFEGKPVKPHVVFAAEGETERAYFHALRTNRYGDRIAFTFSKTRDHSSLTKLVEAIRREGAVGGFGVTGAWIVCDVDENACHKGKLDKWLGESEKHRAAISHPCIEYWFLLHFCESPSSGSAQGVVKELEKAWPQYRKGGQVPSELIEATDEAVRRAHQRRKSLGDDADAWNSPQWTDMPELIAWLDELDPGETRH